MENYTFQKISSGRNDILNVFLAPHLAPHLAIQSIFRHKMPPGRHPGTPQYPPTERTPHTSIQRPIHPVPIRSHTKPIRGHTTRNKSTRKPAIGMGTKKPQKAPKQPCGKTSPKPKARLKSTSNLSPKLPQLLNPNESQFNLPKHFVLNPRFLTLSFPVYSITNPSHFVLWGITDARTRVRCS